ncbi:three-Cys-motif partner protein TcmP [Trinickia sp. NRRL B-1857]|uniref:three-Cys-motif partner protein TcmP n=1 Tax=Trinickia sp. NRRL B-1857 TaxID=3162879 RepID=UPI003D2B3C22
MNPHERPIPRRCQHLTGDHRKPVSKPRGERTRDDVGHDDDSRHRQEREARFERRIVAHVLEKQAQRKHEPVIAEVQREPRQRTYIDLFAGTGRVQVKYTSTFSDGGPLAAWTMAQQRRGTFPHFFVADANPEYWAACDERLRKRGAPVQSVVGRADQTIDWVIPQLDRRGLHLALLDPFNAGNLHFSIIEKLASMPFIDIVVHLSTVSSAKQQRFNHELAVSARPTRAG